MHRIRLALGALSCAVGLHTKAAEEWMAYVSRDREKARAAGHKLR